MAEPNDWKTLINKWGMANHPVGDPKLDALYSIMVSSGFPSVAIDDGLYFSGFINRQVAAPDVTYRVIKTGSRAFELQSINTNIDYSDSSDGEIEVIIDAFAKDSISNTWSYTGGVAGKAGKSLNTEFINDLPVTDVISGADVTLSGDADFVLLYEQVLIDTSSNRETIGSTESVMLADGRKLVVPPNSEMLVRTVVNSDGGNTIGLITTLNFTEVDK